MPVDLALLLASIFPSVENPWPDTIGIEFPFALAGGGGVLGGIAHVESAAAQRDRAIAMGGLLGFRWGAVFYVVSLLNQITLGICDVLSAEKEHATWRWAQLPRCSPPQSMQGRQPST